MNKSVLLTTFLLSISLALLAKQKPIKEYWVFQDKYTVMSLQLDSDSNFSWHSYSYYGKNKFKGQYKRLGDTIVLEKPFKSVRLLQSENKLYLFQSEQKKYTDAQPMVRVTKKEMRRLTKARRERQPLTEEQRTDRINKTAEDVAPFLELLLRGLSKR